MVCSGAHISRGLKYDMQMLQTMVWCATWSAVVVRAQRWGRGQQQQCRGIAVVQPAGVAVVAAVRAHCWGTGAAAQLGGCAV